MFGKIILVVLVTFAAYLIGLDALKCYSYEGKNVKNSTFANVTCSTELATKTNTTLSAFLDKLPTYVTTDKFSCLKIAYKLEGNELLYRGCMFQNVTTCNLKLKESLKAGKISTCNHCDGELCNPAGRTVGQLSVIGVSSILVFIMKYLS